MTWLLIPGLHLPQVWAISSVGRALHSHCRGHWFETGIAHQLIRPSSCIIRGSAATFDWHGKVRLSQPKVDIFRRASFRIQAQKKARHKPGFFGHEWPYVAEHMDVRERPLSGQRRIITSCHPFHPCHPCPASVGHQHLPAVRRQPWLRSSTTGPIQTQRFAARTA